jgi:integrase
MAIYKNGINKNYYYSFQFKKKRFQGSTGVSEKDKAYKIYLEKKNQITSHRFRYIDKTFQELANHYYESYSKNDQRSLDWFLRHLGDRKLEEISGPELKQLQEFRALRVKGSTVNRQFVIIRSLLNKAVTDLGWLSQAPKFKKEKELEPPKRILSSYDQDRFMKYLPQHLKRIVIFALNTGLRKGTIAKLNYDMYDYSKRILSVPAEIIKTKKSLDIPLNAEAHKAIMNTEFGSIHSRGLGVHLRQRPIFTYNGERIKDPGASAWRRAKRRAGIDIRFHDLRHTWATRCIEGGMPIAYVQYLGGWSSPKMMQRYINITPENLKELRKFGY